MAMRTKMKVRTGCTTCKLRKVKCDEARPFCHRCKALNRKCEGYATADPQPTRPVTLEYNATIARSKPRAQTAYLLPRLPSETDPLLSLPLDLQEARWLKFFSTRTGPTLTPFSDDQSFWSQHVPRLGMEQPAIRHALLAVATFHERFETMHGAADSSRSAIGGSFTVKHYNLAICELQRAIDDKSCGLEVPLVCCLLFVILECLYGNYPLVLSHLRNGQSILKLPEFHLTGAKETVFIRKKLQQIFNKLVAHSTLFGAPPIALTPQDLYNEDHMGPDNYEPFVDATDAKSSLDIIISSSLNYIKSLYFDSGVQRRPATDDDEPSQRILKDRLKAWECRLTASERSVPQSIDSDDPSVITLKIEHRAIFIYLSRCLEYEESSFDAYVFDFIQILNLVRKFNEKQPRGGSGFTVLLSRAFSLESSFVSALFLTAYKCRDPVLRREAIALLEAHPSREGLWDAALHAKIGRRVVELEETKMLLFEGAEYAAMEEAPSTRLVASNGAGMTQWPLERFRVYNIRRTSEDPARSARVTFFTAPHGLDEPRVIWDEDFEL